jgi:tRNA pseudouridine32 synthase/23S rRNA pseudouridine746 synthase
MARPIVIPHVSPEDAAALRAMVLFEDAAILVLDKPAGLPVQGGSGVSRDIDGLLWAFATRKGRKPRLVHRLDRDTSGVLVVAKTQPAAAHLSAQFAGRKTRKTYLAIACGAAPKAGFPGICETPLVRMKRNGVDLARPSAPDAPRAMAAKTRFKVLADGPAGFLVRAEPETGRMHQIRAHLAHLGHPIAGDVKYGGLLHLAGLPVGRAMLHAARLALVHPTSGEPMTFDAAPPQDFATLALATTVWQG